MVGAGHVKRTQISPCSGCRGEVIQLKLSLLCFNKITRRDQAGTHAPHGTASLGPATRSLTHSRFPQENIDPGLYTKVNISLDFVGHITAEIRAYYTIPGLSIFFLKRLPNIRRDTLVWFANGRRVVKRVLSNVNCPVHHFVGHILREDNFFLFRHG